MSMGTGIRRTAFACLLLVAVVATSRPVHAAGDCDLDASFISGIPGHVPADTSIAPGSLGRELDAIDVSEGVELRIFLDELGGAVVQIFMLDHATRERATTAIGGLTAGFLSDDRVRDVRDLDVGYLAKEATFRQDDLEFVVRIAEMRAGRVSVATTSFVVAEIDDPIFERAFLFDLLEAQVANLDAACLRDDRSLLPPDASSQAAQLLGGGLAVVGLLGGAATVVAGLRDRTTRDRWFRRKQSPTARIEGFHVHDVREGARARLRVARGETAAIVTGVTIASLAAMAPARGEPAYLLAIPAGIAIAMTIAWLVRRDATSAARRTPNPWYRVGRRRWVSGTLVLVSWASAVVGFVGAIFWLYTSQLSENALAVAAAQAGIAADTYRNQGLALLLVATAFAGLFYRLARWVAQRSARDIVARDDRPSVLLLRSFDDDGLKIHMRSHRYGLAGRLNFRRRERFEELLAWMLSTYGPVIAIGEPNRRRRRIGAAREWIAQENWLDVVEERLAGAQIVAMVVGATGGLLEEASAVAGHGRVDDTLFVIPPLAGPDVSERWAAVAEVVGLDGGIPAEDAGTAVVALEDGELHAYTGAIRDDLSYQAALDAALRDR